MMFRITRHFGRVQYLFIYIPVGITKFNKIVKCMIEVKPLIVVMCFVHINKRSEDNFRLCAVCSGRNL